MTSFVYWRTGEPIAASSHMPSPTHLFGDIYMYGIVVVALLCAPGTSAVENEKMTCDQRSSEIIQDCVKAMGGPLLKRADNLLLTGSFFYSHQKNAVHNDVLRDLECVVVGVKTRMKHFTQVISQVEYSDGISTWHKTNDGDYEFRGKPKFAPDLIPWPAVVQQWKDRNTIEFVDEILFADLMCWKLKFTNVAGQTSFRFFDKQSHLPIGAEYEDKKAKWKNVYKFTKHRGYQLPLNIKKEASTVDKARIIVARNLNVDKFGAQVSLQDVGFELPEKPHPPLPSQQRD